MSALTLKGAYTYTDAADYCGCSEQQLRNYVNDGRLSPVYHGTKPVFLREELDDFLAHLPSERVSR